MAISALREQEECEILKNSYAQLQDIFDGTYASNMAMGEALRKQQWISVDERLPGRDEKCLCRYTFGTRAKMYFYQVLDYYATDPQPHFQHAGKGSGMRVTHWMPLPEAPKEE